MAYTFRNPYVDPLLGDEEDEFFPGAVAATAPLPRPAAYEMRNGIADAPPPPVQAQPNRTAMMELAEHQAKRPLQSEHQAGGWRKALGAIAGGLQGAGEGYLAVRGFRAPQGGNIGEAIVNAPYRRAMSEYSDKEDALARSAQLEAQQIEHQRREAESAARIGASAATAEAARARRDRANAPPPMPRPISVAPGHELRDPVTGTTVGPKASPRPDPLPSNAHQRIERINRDPQMTLEQKKVAAQQVIDEENQMHPRQPQIRLSTDAAGNVSVVSVGADGVPTVSRAGEKPIGKPQRPPGAGRQMTPGQQATADAQMRATQLLQQHGGNIDQAIANSTTDIPVQTVLLTLKRQRKLAEGSGNDRFGRIRSLLGGSPGTRPAAAPSKPDPAMFEK